MGGFLPAVKGRRRAVTGARHECPRQGDYTGLGWSATRAETTSTGIAFPRRVFAMARYIRADEAPIRSWITLLGIIPLYGGIGFAMTGYINFWVGVVVLILTAVALAVHFWLANEIRPLRIRITGVIVISAALAATLWLVFVSAPIDVLISAPPGNYQKGTRVLSLEWKDGETPVQVRIANESELPYENFDSYYRVDSTTISRVGIYSGINTCAATPENKISTLAQASISVDGVSIPLFQPDQQNPASVYRVRCNKLAAHSHIDIVLAIAGSEKPKWDIGSFRYDALNRHRGPQFFPKCLVEPCKELPSTFVGG
jgi:hypothetical protein